jgi:hypothetical protein
VKSKILFNIILEDAVYSAIIVLPVFHPNIETVTQFGNLSKKRVFSLVNES